MPTEKSTSRIQELLDKEAAGDLSPDEEGLLSVARSRGLVAPRTPAESDTKFIKGGKIDWKQVGTSALETGAELTVPGYNTYETLQNPPPADASMGRKALAYGGAAVSDVLSAIPIAKGAKLSVDALRKGMRLPVPGGVVPKVAGVDVAREAAALADENLMKKLSRGNPDPLYAKATALANQTGEVFAVPETTKAIDTFLSRYQPQEISKTTSRTLVEPGSMVERRVAKTTEPSSTTTRTVTKPGYEGEPNITKTDIEGTTQNTTQTRTTTSGKTSTKETTQELERFPSGMEKTYRDLAVLRDNINQWGGVIPPAEWKSVKNRVQSAFNALEGDPISGDVAIVLDSMKKDLGVLDTPAARLMQAGDDAYYRQQALKVLSDAANKNIGASITRTVKDRHGNVIPGKPIKRIDAGAVVEAMHQSKNRRLMGTFNAQEKAEMERTWLTIRGMQELDTDAKKAVDTSLTMMHIPMTPFSTKFGGHGKAGVPYDSAVALVNAAMLLPDGPRLIRSVTQKGILTQTGQIMLANFLLQQVRALTGPQPLELNK